MIDNGSARARRFIAREARVTESGTAGSLTNLPPLTDVKLTRALRESSAAGRIERDQPSMKGNTRKDFSDNTTVTPQKMLKSLRLLTGFVSVALSQLGRR